MKTFLHLLGWRLKQCKWYFLILFGSLGVLVAAWGTPLVWISITISSLILAFSASIVYLSCLFQGGKEYLSTRPVGWRAVFWSRCVTGSLISLLALASIIFIPSETNSVDPVYWFLIMFPLFLNLYLWSMGGIAISRHVNGSAYGIIAFTIVLAFLWKYFSPMFKTTVMLFPEGTESYHGFSIRRMVMLHSLLFFSPIFSFGLLGIVESSLYRRRPSLPIGSLFCIVLFIGIVLLGSHLLKFNGQTSCYELPYKTYGSFLGYKQMGKGIVFIAEKERQDNNTLFYLDTNNLKAQPAPICIVGATWDRTKSPPDRFPMIGMAPGMMFDATQPMIQDSDFKKQPVTQEDIEESSVPYQNPYEGALIQENRIFLFGSKQYELLEFDGEQVKTILPSQKMEDSIQQYIQCDPELVTYCTSFSSGKGKMSYHWYLLNLRTGKVEENMQPPSSRWPNYEFEIGTRRYRLEGFGEWGTPEKVVIEDSTLPSGTGNLGEIPWKGFTAVDENQVAGFVKDGTYWPSGEIHLYDVSHPASPTYVTIEIPLQFYDSLTLSDRYLNSYGLQIDWYESLDPVLRLRFMEPFLLLGGGYLAFCHGTQIAIWDISNVHNPQLLGIAPLRNENYHSDYFPDLALSNYMMLLDYFISGPTTPLNREDGSIGYVGKDRDIEWFKFPQKLEDQ